MIDNLSIQELKENIKKQYEQYERECEDFTVPAVDLVATLEDIARYQAMLIDLLEGVHE